MASPGDSDGAPQAELQPSSSGSRDITMADRLENARSLTIKVLQDITDNFSAQQKIGQGSCGMVYLGMLENGEEIAVKMLYNSMPGIDDEQFKQEFENLMMLEHPNIVRLVGYCYETQHLPMQYMGRMIFAEKTYRALCFEYMQNGSLQKHLSDECEGLDWHTRYKIIKGTSEGLKYLHEGFKEPIYHLDLKPDNILLDKNMVPKLADFGLSKLFGDEQTRITQSPIGTIGYLPMEYLHGNLVSNKLDIFSLGVVMTKIIAGPRGNSRCVEMPHQEFLDQVHKNWRNRLQAACHASRPLEAYCKQVNICLEIALRCMEIDRHKRPNIADIIHQLNDTEAAIDELKDMAERLPPEHGSYDCNDAKQVHNPNGVEPHVALYSSMNGVHQSRNELLNASNAHSPSSVRSSHSNGISSQHKLLGNISENSEGSTHSLRITSPHETDLPHRRAHSNSDEMLSVSGKADDNVSIDARSLQNGEDGYKPRGTISISSNQVQAEWIEQYEPGVYITLTALRDGTRDLKKVRFSRRRFGEHQAENWWSENRDKVYERYNVRSSERVSSAASTRSAY